ncbi:LamG-like jellyroll fold domain-containing protein [Actinoplanes sp. CA-015351]|uniref:LamG-like jellyroll fold domain-containing protein n=1 Tax=Actinoplanes sp. CA-015351 TaxID=3239897 RepID=UPI003D9734FA
MINHLPAEASGPAAAPPPAGVLEPSVGVRKPSAGVLKPSAGVLKPSAGVLEPFAGVLDSAGSVSARSTPGQVRVAGGPVSLRYDFDNGVGRPIADLRGRYELRPLGQNGGRLRLVRQGGGLAVDYPDRCTLPRERDCPRAILEGVRDDTLNPGRRALRYGASVLMTHADLADGANVLQKGYSVGGVSQFKLQVDHRQGHPSCVVAGQRARIYRAEPTMDVADGTWHALECRRTPNRLIMFVDGVLRAWVPIPPLLSIANAEPLRVGGKGAAPGNDQFAGAIDNVFLTITS